MNDLTARLNFLSREEREAVLRDLRDIRRSPRNSLYVGERLNRLQNKMAPYGFFAQIVAASGLALRTAYGYLYGYRNAVRLLPPGAVKAMMDAELLVNARAGYKGPLGIWTDVVKQNPPPFNGSAASYDRWVREIQEKRERPVRGKLANRVKRDPDELLAETFRFLDRQRQRIPGGAVARASWLRELVGMALTRFEMEKTEFKPIDIPADCLSPRNQFSHRL